MTGTKKSVFAGTPYKERIIVFRKIANCGKKHNIQKYQKIVVWGEAKSQHLKI